MRNTDYVYVWKSCTELGKEPHLAHMPQAGYPCYSECLSQELDLRYFCQVKYLYLCFSEPTAHDESKYNCLSNLFIEKKIGKGQFSEVYRAKCLIDNETVALKKIQVDSCIYELIFLVLPIFPLTVENHALLEIFQQSFLINLF